MVQCRYGGCGLVQCGCSPVQVWWVWSSAGVVGVVQCRYGGCGLVQVWWVWSSAGVVGVVRCRCSGSGPVQALFTYVSLIPLLCVCVHACVPMCVQVLSDLREAEEVQKDREGLHQQTLRWSEEERSRLAAAHSNLQQSKDQCRWDWGTGSATPCQCRVCCAV